MPLFSNLTTLTAASVEPVSLELARKHLRVDFTDEDELIGFYLTAAREWIEGYLGMALALQQLLWVTATVPFVGAAPFVALPFPIQINPLWFPWPGTLGQPTALPRAPVVSVEFVSYGAWGQADTVLPDTSYQVDVALGRLRFTYDATPAGHDHIAIRFTAGYATPAQIPSSIRFGVLLMLAHFYENRGDQPTDPPAAIHRLLSLHRRLTFGG